MSTELKTIHDRLVAMKPEGASCPADCPFCVVEVASENNSPNGGSVSDKTYTEDEHNAVLAKVADLEAKVTELTAASATSEIDVAVTAAKTELEAQIADLQTKLDTATLEAEAAKKNHDETVAYLAGEAAAVQAAAELEARKGDRVAKVKEVASFPDEYLDANADRFAAMSDEAFEAALEDWKAVAAKSDKPAKDDIPSTTAMTASRSNDSTPNVLSEVMGFRFTGVDPRTV